MRRFEKLVSQTCDNRTVERLGNYLLTLAPGKNALKSVEASLRASGFGSRGDELRVEFDELLLADERAPRGNELVVGLELLHRKIARNRFRLEFVDAILKPVAGTLRGVEFGVELIGEIGLGESDGDFLRPCRIG